MTSGRFVRIALGVAMTENESDTQDDGIWMTASSFTIFTMTAGLAYWMFGFGFTFGSENPFLGMGDYFFDPERDDNTPLENRTSYALFLFQMSFATTTSTIVSVNIYWTFLRFPTAGGGMVTVLISRMTTKKIEVDTLIDGMLASLVSSTALLCSFVEILLLRVIRSHQNIATKSYTPPNRMTPKEINQDLEVPYRVVERGREAIKGPK
uniref:Ammonium_transp domain-containing protein n=1 Tax=Heterorhabditis bacteriophora TaxID=37862 RepID=A0A1I7WF03_HETBA